MRLLRMFAPLFLAASFCFADLTPQQKQADFMQLAALYDVNYAPYELKLQLYNFDMLSIQPWLTQVAASQNDIQFYDICVRYVASLQDSHDEFTILSDYDAWLHFDGDIYDGVFLIDYVDRSYLPSKTFNFTVGDQLISVDGVPVATLLTQYAPYAVNGSANPVSRARIAAATITEHYQGWFPTGAVGASATIVVQHADGSQSTYTVPWDVSGTLVTTAGLFPSPMASASKAAHLQHAARRVGVKAHPHPRGTDPGPAPMPLNPWLRAGVDPDYTPIVTDNTPDPEPPSYMAPLTKLTTMQAAAPLSAISGDTLVPFDSLYPVFNPPAGFKLRLGASSTDNFLSGTFPAGAGNIGFIRIPTFAPTSTNAAVNQFNNEIQYFQANTDGLVIDVMGNGGGSLCYGQTLASFLIPTQFQGATEQLRATLNWQVDFDSSRLNAIAHKSPDWVVQLYTFYLTAIEQALASNRAMTGPIPLCSATSTTNPATSTTGKNLAYTKPVLTLTDNFTLSTAEFFTMLLQDNKRATVFGTRTDGGGGNVVGYSNVTNYSEGDTRVTEGLLPRLNPVAANGFPVLPYYDSVGIQPDIVQDYMTASNLATGGKAFVNAAMAAIRTLTGK